MLSIDGLKSGGDDEQRTGPRVVGMPKHASLDVQILLSMHLEMRMTALAGDVEFPAGLRQASAILRSRG
jgi:hypothetical protein